MSATAWPGRGCQRVDGGGDGVAVGAIEHRSHGPAGKSVGAAELSGKTRQQSLPDGHPPIVTPISSASHLALSCRAARCYLNCR
jgi:hypothetical protein